MKLVCEIELPDTADYKTKLDAIAKASWDEKLWKQIYSREHNMTQTCLDNKCGSCKYFMQFENSVRGNCSMGHVWGQRSRPACKKYERI